MEYANNMGIFIIVIDLNPNSPAKKIASKSYDIDSFDVENIIKVAKEEKVDEKIKKMIKSLNIKNGLLNIQF